MDGVVADTTEPNHTYRYNGKELDEVSKTYEYGFRYYDPTIGRFTGVDPIADQFAWVSPFNYAENEPIAHIDLHGLQSYYSSAEYHAEQMRKAGMSNDFVDKWLENNYQQQRVAAATIAAAMSPVDETTAAWWAINKIPGAANLLTKVGSGIVRFGDYLWNSAGGWFKGSRKSIDEFADQALSLEEAAQIRGGSWFKRGNANDFKFAHGHSADEIEKSWTFNKKIKNLSDEDLIKTLDPDNPNWEPITIKKGIIYRGNNRIYEVQKRGLDIDIRYRELPDDNSQYFFDY